MLSLTPETDCAYSCSFCFFRRWEKPAGVKKKDLGFYEELLWQTDEDWIGLSINAGANEKDQRDFKKLAMLAAFLNKTVTATTLLTVARKKPELFHLCKYVGVSLDDEKHPGFVKKPETILDSLSKLSGAIGFERLVVNLTLDSPKVLPGITDNGFLPELFSLAQTLHLIVPKPLRADRDPKGFFAAAGQIFSLCQSKYPGRVQLDCGTMAAFGLINECPVNLAVDPFGRVRACPYQKESNGTINKPEEIRYWESMPRKHHCLFS
jgi:hypothetical protein